MKYIKLVISVDDEYQEALITELMELEFDAFEQQEDKLITYVTKERFSDVNRERIEQVLAAFPGNGFIHSEEVVTDRNWNEEWEQTIRGQKIGRFFVKPTWDPARPAEDDILLEIDPKMAFGTGYHESTRLMLHLLPEVTEESDSVLDAGTGSGILAIASVKLGAASVFAFDIDDWSITNTKENILLNNVSGKVTVKKGSSEVIPANKAFDVVLANIERNTILELLPALNRALKSGGDMLLSGLLEKDGKTVFKRAEGLGLRRVNLRQENEWIAIRLRKS